MNSLNKRCFVLLSLLLTHLRCSGGTVVHTVTDWAVTNRVPQFDLILTLAMNWLKVFVLNAPHFVPFTKRSDFGIAYRLVWSSCEDYPREPVFLLVGGL